MAAGSVGGPGQLAFNIPNFEGTIRRLDIWQDYGPITTGSGASQPHYAAVENGSEYLIKGASLTPGEPYVAANELVAALIINCLGLPILDFGVAEDIRGNIFFASRYLDKGQFHPALTEPLLDKCNNLERIYNVVVLDIWTRNTDRNTLNLLVREIRGGTHFLVLNDHSRCLVQPGETPASLPPLAKDGNIARYRVTPFIWDRITDPHWLGDAITDIEHLEDATIAALVRTIPDDLLSVDDQRDVIDFLTDRKSVLRQIIRSERAEFSHLESGPI